MKKEMRPYNKLVQIGFEQVALTEGFWFEKQKLIRENSIPKQLEKLEEYRHIDNFRIAAGIKDAIFRGLFFFDSDLYKWLEASCMILTKHKDKELESKVEEIVDLISNAQEDDGYLNTFYSIMFPERKFSNLPIMHELYCMGHFFEAAIAYYAATGKDTLLNIASKCVDLLIHVFMENKLKGAPGHQEIELALISLYRLSQEKKYLNLAKEFLDRRGSIPKYRRWVLKAVRNASKTLKEAKKKEEIFEENNDDRYEIERVKVNIGFLHSIKGAFRIFREYLNGKYAQYLTIRKMTEPVGHAVRAMYLYIAMADLYSETGDDSLLIALKKIWDKMVEARMYITGGTGSIAVLEGFGKDYELNNFHSYSETCAAIGNMLWNLRMTQITRNPRYADLVEKLMYNAMLVGPSIDCTTYMYNNPLASKGKDVRHEWYMVACCPSNIARTISSIEKFIYSISDNNVWIHQFISSKFKFNNTEIQMDSEFPWEGKIKIKVSSPNNKDFSLYLRIPSWCDDFELSINNKEQNYDYLPHEYLEVRRKWDENEIVELDFEMKPKIIKGNPKVKSNRGRGAIVNGPLVYCLEQKDNQANVLKATISKNPKMKVVFKKEFLGGINIIEGKLKNGSKFTAIPYFTWLNRGSNRMQVWNKVE